MRECAGRPTETFDEERAGGGCGCRLHDASRPEYLLSAQAVPALSLPHADGSRHLLKAAGWRLFVDKAEYVFLHVSMDRSDELALLRAARVLLGWQQRELVKRARVSVEMITRIESGDRRVTFLTYDKVASALENGGIVFIPETEERMRGISLNNEMRGPVSEENLIRAARALLGMRQEGLARQAGISRQGIIRVEHGDGKVTRDTINAVRNALEREGIEFLPETRERMHGIALKRAKRGRASERNQSPCS